jgi:uncharacterized membrane protein YphA (DoxX/SURF4 family)
MGILFKARGTSSFGLLIMRIIVGSYTLSLGIMQASNIEAYIAKVKAMNVLSENTAFIASFAFPFILIIFGSLYIMGFFTPVTSFILALVSLLKIIARGLFPTPGVPFNKDMIIFACFVLTLFSGAGKISFDVFLDKKKKKGIQPTTSATVTAEVVTDTKPENPPPS